MKDEKYKHISNMQHLLEQYDRQNRFLNVQVLQLLRQNSRLKERKLGSAIFSALSSEAINRPRRIDSTSITKPIPKASDIIASPPTKQQELKEQGSNTVINMIVKNQNEDKQKQTTVQNNHQESSKQIIKQIDIPNQVIADQSFSFRKTPVKTKQDIYTETKNNTSFSIVSKVTQQTIYFGEGNSHSRFKQEISVEKLNKSQSQSSSFSRFRATSNQKQGRHELKPSPKIDDKSIPKDRINMSPLVRKKSNNQRQKIMNRVLQSGQKKRRFIEVISNRFTPPKITRQTVKDACNCC